MEAGRQALSNVIGFDDAPFEPGFRGNVPVVGTVYAGSRFDGLLLGKVRRDGANATRNLTELISASRFAEHAQLVMLQGIALAGFNVVDVPTLSRNIGLPVLVVARREPDLAAIKDALIENVPGGRRKWRLIERLGPMVPVGSLFVQSIGMTLEQAGATVERFAINGHIPEPLRTAHLIAGALSRGQSHGRA